MSEMSKPSLKEHEDIQSTQTLNQAASHLLNRNSSADYVFLINGITTIIVGSRSILVTVGMSSRLSCSCLFKHTHHRKNKPMTLIRASTTVREHHRIRYELTRCEAKHLISRARDLVTNIWNPFLGRCIAQNLVKLKCDVQIRTNTEIPRR